MQFDELVEGMSEAVYQRLQQAVETGKWPDGQSLSEAQRSQSQQLVMAWQARHLHQNQHLTIGPDGQIVQLSKQQLKNQFSVIPSKNLPD